jgi:hypothetical protein
MILLISSSIIVSSLANFAYAADNNVIDINNMSVRDIEGQRYSQIANGSFVILDAEIKSNVATSQPYIVLIEVRNSNDLTVSLQFQTGILKPFDSTEIGNSWLPEKTGVYKLRAFALSNFESPEILSGVFESSITVRTTAIREESNEIEDNPEDIQNAVADDKGIEAVYDVPSTGKLKEYALDKINEDREKSGLAPVLMSTNQAAQIHAEDVLKTRQISHWMTNGEKPYMTYTENGGLGYVQQNIAIQGFEKGKCEGDEGDGKAVCMEINPFQAIDEAEHDMIYNDKICCDNGHKDNILDKLHTHVSIGIAYNDYFFVLVQNFENNYVEFSKPITNQPDDKYIQLIGKLMYRNLTAVDVVVHYDEMPTDDIYEINKEEDSYSFGDAVGCLVPSFANWYCTGNIITIEADTWGHKTSPTERIMDIEANIYKAESKPGIYTIILILEDEEGNRIPGLSYSIFHQ